MGDRDFRMADMMLRVGTPQAPAAWTEGDVKGPPRGSRQAAERGEGMGGRTSCPRRPRPSHGSPFLLNVAYQELKEFIPGFEKRRALTGHAGSGAAEEFVPSDNYRVCRWHGREYTFNKNHQLP